jgi:beta-aspartyl-peptidase (threonine type)
MSQHCIVIHGGAGTILRSTMNAELEKAYRGGLQQALTAGDNVLKNGGAALDAVEAAIVEMENNPLFNAGKGSVFTHDGKNEMDSSLMSGTGLAAGAVAGVTSVKNPIKLARAVMEKSEHVLLCGAGALEFAKLQRLELEPDSYFFVQQRYDQLLEIRDSGKTQMDHSAPSGEPKKFGTVGAVALDMQGNLAAGTSTGGMTNKRFGRAGDTPIIGAGTYANNLTCAVSCTGHGEYFIRAVVAYDVSCLMEYKNLSLKEACDLVVHQKLVKLGGEGGLIAIDSKGNAEMPFNSDGMYRGIKRAGENFETAIYGA